MDLFKKVPYDIKIIILDFYYELLFSKKMKRIIKEIPRKALIRELSIKSLTLNHNFTIQIGTNNLFSTNDNDHQMFQNECVQAINKLNGCMCCSRHNFNKPDKSFIIENKFINYPQNFDHNNTCNCQCRHLARWIVREYTENIYPYIPDNYSSNYNNII